MLGGLNFSEKDAYKDAQEDAYKVIPPSSYSMATKV